MYISLVLKEKMYQSSFVVGQTTIMDVLHLKTFQHCYEFSLYLNIVLATITLHIRKGEILKNNSDLKVTEDRINAYNKQNDDIRLLSPSPANERVIEKNNSEVRTIILI